MWISRRTHHQYRHDRAKDKIQQESEREDVLKIQQESEREDVLKIQQESEKEVFKIQQLKEGFQWARNGDDDVSTTCSLLIKGDWSEEEWTHDKCCVGQDCSYKRSAEVYVIAVWDDDIGVGVGECRGERGG